ncbi:MAG TPA: SRPBCC domain-containing protein [Crinalium sp.]|jgi:hypothetical protein
MPRLYSEITINAPRSAVWQALIRKEDWLKWNTYLFDRAPGKPFERGRSLLLSLRRVDGEDETEFQATVTLVQPNICLKWVSSAPGFKNEQVFELQDVGLRQTKYIHQQQFSGLFTRVAFPLIRQDEQQGMTRMAHELRKYVEYLIR